MVSIRIKIKYILESNCIESLYNKVPIEIKNLFSNIKERSLPLAQENNAKATAALFLTATYITKSALILASQDWENYFYSIAKYLLNLVSLIYHALQIIFPMLSIEIIS